MRLLIILAVTFLLGGCLTEKKVANWNDKHPLESAEYCAEKYPCKMIPGDTTIIYGDTSKLLAAIEDLEKTVIFINEVNDSLIIALRHDKNCKQYESVIQRQKIEIESLKRKIKPSDCVPDTIRIKGDTIIDSAGIQAIRLKYNKEIVDHATTKNQVNKLKDKLNWWKIACIITWALIAIFLALKFGSKLKL